MRIQHIVSYAFHLAGVGIALFYGYPILAVALVYVGFLIQNHHTEPNQIKQQTDGNNSSTRYVVQCKGESGWFDLEQQKYPRKTLLQYSTYKLAKNQLDNILNTRDSLESERLRIIKRTAIEDVV